MRQTRVKQLSRHCKSRLEASLVGNFTYCQSRVFKFHMIEAMQWNALESNVPCIMMISSNDTSNTTAVRLVPLIDSNGSSSSSTCQCQVPPRCALLFIRCHCRHSWKRRLCSRCKEASRRYAVEGSNIAARRKRQGSRSHHARRHHGHFGFERKSRRDMRIYEFLPSFGFSTLSLLQQRTNS